MQITPEHAPIVVAAVGGQDEVDQRIVIPSIRSLVPQCLRRLYHRGGRPNAEGRTGDHLAADAGARHHRKPRRSRAGDPGAARRGTAAAPGVDIKEIRLGKSAIPPELLLARQREQLATS